jgi:hypothetical protein
MSRFSKVVLIGSVAVCAAFAAFLYFRTRFAIPAGKLEMTASDADRKPELPPGEPAPISFVALSMSSSERQRFLAGDYTILPRVADLPGGIQRLYRVNGGTRIAMADPGEKFEATDVITDPDVPGRRLILAGIGHDRAFVHYEEGGIAHYYVIELFRLETSGDAVGLWRGYCGPAKNLEDIRQMMLAGNCIPSETVPQLRSDTEVKWQTVDQLCGDVELAAPTKKTIVVNGKTETRLYVTQMRNAEVTLYKGAARDKACCGSAAPLARALSGRSGQFEFSGFQRGLYWLAVQKGSFSGAIPLQLTDDFNTKSCREPSTARSFIVDAQPPTVETRIL